MPQDTLPRRRRNLRPYRKGTERLGRTPRVSSLASGSSRETTDRTPGRPPSTPGRRPALRSAAEREHSHACGQRHETPRPGRPLRLRPDRLRHPWPAPGAAGASASPRTTGADGGGHRPGSAALGAGPGPAAGARATSAGRGPPPRAGGGAPGRAAPPPGSARATARADRPRDRAGAVRLVVAGAARPRDGGGRRRAARRRARTALRPADPRSGRPPAGRWCTR